MGTGLGDRQNAIMRRLKREKDRCDELPDLWHPLGPGRLGHDVREGIGRDLALIHSRSPRQVVVAFRRAATTLAARHLIEKSTRQGCVLVRRVLTLEDRRRADDLRARYDFHFEAMVRAQETGQFDDAFREHERWVEWFETKMDIYQPQSKRAG
ncbi:hypothetical protein ABZ942_04790 [Nocardia sp. NPDC046473]|uniref:hypothetical protein n=1 Tax=Nocardia sp. NPDC046473 TaxID=3155733 RepID=UPI0033FD7FB0